MTLGETIRIVASNAVVFAILQLVASTWLKANLEGSILHGYDRRLEEYRRELDRRDRAAAIAELFAEWASESPNRKTLNRLTWEATLWLPTDIVRDVHKRLSNSPDARDVREILVEVRHLLRGGGDDITATEIVHFPRT